MTLPQERKDTGLLAAILVIVILAVGGLAFAASQAPTSLEKRDATVPSSPLATPQTDLPEVQGRSSGIIEDSYDVLPEDQGGSSGISDDSRPDGAEKGGSQ